MKECYVIMVETQVTKNEEVYSDGVVSFRPVRPAGVGWAKLDVREKSIMWSRVKLKDVDEKDMTLSRQMTFFEEAVFKSIAAYIRDLAE